MGRRPSIIRRAEGEGAAVSAELTRSAAEKAEDAGELDERRPKGGLVRAEDDIPSDSRVSRAVRRPAAARANAVIVMIAASRVRPNSAAVLRAVAAALEALGVRTEPGASTLELEDRAIGSVAESGTDDSVAGPRETG